MPLNQDTADIRIAKERIDALPPLDPVQGVDTNILDMVQPLVDPFVSGVIISIHHTNENPTISSNGVIVYNDENISMDAIFALNKESGVQALSSVLVNVHMSYDDQDILTAKGILEDISALGPIEGIDTDIVNMAQSFIEDQVSDVVITIHNSSGNDNISTDGSA